MINYNYLFKNKLMKDPVLKSFAADKKHVIKLKTIIIEKLRQALVLKIKECQISMELPPTFVDMVALD